MTNEHKLARALVAAHVAPEVAPIVLESIDEWAGVVEQARDALENQQRNAEDLRRYYTVQELMLMLRKSDSGVRALLDDGTLPFARIGGGIRVPIDAVERYLEEQTTRNEQQKPRTQRRRRSEAEADVLNRYPWLSE
jgi:excisionase family DNA binding protein